MRSVFQNIPDEVVVLVKRRKVVMMAAMNAYKGNFMRIDLLQFFAMGNGY